jgi:NAD(P)-dependent dehydrogenase (short-subunit alcohol dehydrogenase family)
MKTVQELFDLKGRVAVVSGGAGLLGFQMATALAEAGAHVVLASRNIAGCQAKADILTDKSLHASALCLDVNDRNSVVRMVEDITRTFGHLDVLVNAAFGISWAPFEEMTSEQWKQSMEATVTGTFLCSQAASAVMVKQRRGSIINIGSIYSVVSPDKRMYPGTSIQTQTAVYAAAKGAVAQFTKVLAAYLADNNVRVNCISPGGFFEKGKEDVEFVRRYSSKCPLGRTGNETDLKGAVVFLASDASAYVTGHNLMVDGGWTIW